MPQCLVCNKEFKGRNNRNSKTCSKVCYAELSRLRKEANTKACSCCGVVYYKRYKSKYCSRACSVKDRKCKDRPCKNCGEPLGRHQKTYCNRECSNAFRKNKMNENILAVQEVKPSAARKYFIDTYGFKCSICGITEWMGQPTPVILDHIDGHSENNKLNNLRLVCPNCDAQLPTFKSKNKGNGRAARRLRYSKGLSY